MKRGVRGDNDWILSILFVLAAVVVPPVLILINRANFSAIWGKSVVVMHARVSNVRDPVSVDGDFFLRCVKGI